MIDFNPNTQILQISNRLKYLTFLVVFRFRFSAYTFLKKGKNYSTSAKQYSLTWISIFMNNFFESLFVLFNNYFIVATVINEYVYCAYSLRYPSLFSSFPEHSFANFICCKIINDTIFICEK